MRVRTALAGLAGVLVAGCGNCNTLSPAPGQVLQECPGVDIVFVMDTSGSMDDEAAALCAQLSSVSSQLTALGLTDLRVTILGITQDGAQLIDDGRPDFACLSDSVLELLGETIPGTPPVGEEFLDDTEDWASGAAIVAARFSWLPGRLRIVVPISDEDPEDGDQDGVEPCDEDDSIAVNNAIAVANANGVVVSPIVAFLEPDPDPQHPCVFQLATQLANGTGGRAFRSSDPTTNFSKAIFDLVVAACTPVG